MSHSRVSTYIFSNESWLASLLAGSMSSNNNVSITFPLQSPFAGNNPQVQNEHTPSTKTSHNTKLSDLEVPNYVFFFLDNNQKWQKSLKKVLSIVSPQTKIAVVIYNSLKQEKGQSLQKKLHRHLSPVVKSNKVNARIIYLHHLFGPGASFSSDTPLGKFFLNLKKQTLSISGGNNEQIYPLFVDDALDAIKKATFSIGSVGKIYHIGGQPISLLNFSYQVREILKNQNFKQALEEAVFENNQELELQIKASQHDLNWQPKSSLKSSLQTTLQHLLGINLDEQSEFASSQPPHSEFLANASGSQHLQIPPPPLPYLHAKSTTPSSLTQNPTYSNPSISPKNFSIKSTPTPNPTQVGQSASTDINQKPGKLKLPNMANLLNFNLPTPLPNYATARPLAVLAILLLILTTPITSTVFSIYNLKQNLSKTQTAIIDQDFQRAFEHSQKATKHAQGLETKLTPLKPISSLLLGEDANNNVFLLISIAKSLSKTATQVSNSLIQATKLISLTTLNPTSPQNQKIESTSSQVLGAYHELSRVESELANNPQLNSINLLSIGVKIQNLASTIPKYRQYLYKSHQLLSVSPKLLGQDSKKTYLVLLQNSAELRPTGGFIGSYALLTFEKGQLLDINVEDVYTADGQLRGHVEPPPEIKKHLGEAGWFLRDSNWDPDFPTSAKRAAWFLEKEMGQHTDGVIGVNLHVIQQLLEVTGPIKIPDYDEAITSGNLFDRVEYQAEVNFFPGSTQKKDFIGALSRALLETISLQSKSQSIDLINAMINSAQQNQLQMFFTDPSINQVVNDLGWSGELFDPQCNTNITSTSCVSDYINLNEANVGVNKANFFIQRTIDQLVDISNTGTIQKTINLTYTNNSPSNTWPGGRYKNYLRIYTPPNSKLLKVTTNNTDIPLDQISLESQHNKTIFGFLVQIDPQTTSSISIKYQLNQTLPTSGLSAYSIYTQKQSGTPSDPFTTTINFPQEQTLLRTSTEVSSGPGVVSTSSTLDSNKSLTVEFAR